MLPVVVLLYRPGEMQPKAGYIRNMPVTEKTAFQVFMSRFDHGIGEMNVFLNSETASWLP